MPESVKRRGSSGPTIGATERSAPSCSSMAMRPRLPRGRGDTGGHEVHARLRTQARSHGAEYACPGSLRRMSGLRSLPSVDGLAGRLDAPHALAVAAARAVIDERRAELLAGEGNGGDADLDARARAWLERVARPSLRRVLNATGVLLHTNLGRAPLAAAARDAVARAADGYANLELDLDGGGRGSRHDHVAGLVRELTGAQAALVVNNGAGAVLLAAAALAGAGREIVVSRGQLVEIGGGFRVPE